jgi:hypothetical protein
VFKENVMARVSYSRYSMWTTCPQQYKFNYVDKLGVYSGSIHTIFGTAFHETLQHYLDIFYNKTKKEANEIDLPQLLKERLVDTFKKEHEGFEEGKFVCSKDELMEFYNDGVICLEWFKKHSDDFGIYPTFSSHPFVGLTFWGRFAPLGFDGICFGGYRHECDARC